MKMSAYHAINAALHAYYACSRKKIQIPPNAYVAVHVLELAKPKRYAVPARPSNYIMASVNE